MNDEVKINGEEILLLKLCHLEFSNEQKEEINGLIPRISDWSYFSRMANAHGIAALVSHNFEKLDLTRNVPGDTLTFLKGAQMKSLSRNTFNQESLCGVLKILNGQNIRTVLLKGMALEVTVYRNEGLRQMTDVDILLSRNDSMKARKILLKNGFESLPVKSLFHNLIISDIGKHLPSLLKNGTSIDIHTELFGGRKIDLTRMLYDNSYVFEVQGEKVYIPRPQIMFLYLVKHLYSHESTNESQMRLYTDLAVMLSRYPDEIIDYNLLKYASDAGISPVLARYLGLLREFWQISFPEWLNDYIDRWYSDESVRKFIFFLKSPKDNPAVGKARYYRNQLSEMRNNYIRTIFVLGDIFPTLSFMKNRYNCNGFKALMYYPHRMGKVLWLLKLSRNRN